MTEELSADPSQMFHNRQSGNLRREAGVPQYRNVDIRMPQMSSQMPNKKAWISHVVIIQKDNQGRSACENPQIFRSRKPAGILPQNAHRESRLPALQNGLGLVRRTIVDDNNFKSLRGETLRNEPFKNARQSDSRIRGQI
jgi:hypothetical protein